MAEIKRQVQLERLKSVLSYSPETGIFHWRQKLSPRGKIGTVAGCLCPSQGYWLIGLDRRLYRAHQLAWLYMTGVWPTSDIDHVDTVRSNNAWANLRLAENFQNQANKPIGRRNTSGYKGVSLEKKSGKWASYIKVDGKTKRLGAFSTPEEAHGAYISAAKEQYGEFARWA